MAIMQGFAPLVVGAIVVGVFASLLLSGMLDCMPLDFHSSVLKFWWFEKAELLCFLMSDAVCD